MPQCDVFATQVITREGGLEGALAPHFQSDNLYTIYGIVS